MSLLTYKYYDSPEGQDVWKKLFVTGKYAACAGLSFSSFDVLMYSHPQGTIATLGRIGYLTGPLVGMAAAFTATANISQNVRGKNDALNYFLGGVSSGAVFGAWQKSTLSGFTVGILLGLFAITKKISIDEGWLFLPECKIQTNSAWSVKNDWSMFEDYPKNYTTGERK